MHVIRELSILFVSSYRLHNLFNTIVAIFCLSCSIPSVLQAQTHVHTALESPTLSAGTGIGYRSIALPIGIVRDSTLSAALPSASLLLQYTADAGLNVPIYDWLGVHAGVQYGGVSGTAIGTRDVTFIINGNPTPGVIKQEHVTHAEVLHIVYGLSFRLTENFSLFASAGTLILSNPSVQLREYIESPSNVQFVDPPSSSRNLTTFEAAGAQNSTTFGVSLSYSKPISDRFALALSLDGSANVTSINNAVSTKPWYIGIGARLQWKPFYTNESDVSKLPMASTTPEPQPIPHNLVRLNRATRDTITRVFPYSIDRTDTVYHDSTIERYDTTYGIQTDTVTYTKHVITVRNLPHPKLFLSAVTDVRVPDVTNDSELLLDISIDVVADTSTTSKLQISLDGRIVLDTTVSGQHYMMRIPVNRLCPDMKSRRTIEFMINTITVDAVGQIFSSTPLPVVLERKKNQWNRNVQGK